MICTLCVNAQMSIDFSTNSPIRKLQIAEMVINNLYVDSVDEKKLVEDAIKGMLEKLDPHSAYSDPEEVKALNEPLQGTFDGIGVQFNMVDDTLLVIQPISKGPSEKVGIMAGDRIISVNDTAIAGVKIKKEDIMKRLRGPRGTTVYLGIVRRGIEEVLHFTVKRDKIPVKSIDAVYMIRPEIGYIRIGNFGATTYREFMEGLKLLKKQGMKDLILDLQDNGGGYLDAAVEISNEFFERNELIVYTEGRRALRKEFRSKGLGEMSQGRVLILTNEFTASAAEIVSGAIQDNDRGCIIGRRTFGKGLVQRPLELPDGSMIRLTIAHYYSPSGRCIQKPYTKGNKKEYDNDFENRLKHGELTNRDSIHFADSLKYYTLKKHRPVYGGGGIMPDVFVPLDTLRYTKSYRQIIAKGLVINNSIKYIDNNRKSLNREYPSFEKFEQSFTVPQKVIDTILKEAEEQKIGPKDEEERQKTLDLLNLQIRALVARDLFDINEYFRIINENSDIVKAALQQLK
ncbi:MAG: S41 family peptidase [Prevotella sp.]